MESSLGKLMNSAVSIRVLPDERSYQMFVAGMPMHMQGRYRITADFESGDGCRDIRMEGVSGTGANVAMELKKTRSEGDLAHLANDALEQSKPAAAPRASRAPRSSTGSRSSRRLRTSSARF